MCFLIDIDKVRFDLVILKQHKITLICLFVLFVQSALTSLSWAQTSTVGAPSFAPEISISGIEVNGNQRIEQSTIESYLLLNIGDTYTEQLGDASLKRLYNTGLFSDVDVGRRGDTLVISVVENPIINRIVFEGNKYKDDEDLYEEIQLRLLDQEEVI